MMVGSRLEKFHAQRSGVYNFRCPFCGDSQRKNKARGYILEDKEGSRYYCHNCGVAFNLSTFLKEFAPDLYHSYRMESLDSIFKVGKKKDEIVESKIKSIQTNMNDPLIHCMKLSDPAAEPVLEYAKSRGIPEKMLADLRAVNDINFITSRIDKYKDQEYPLMKSIVIPFYNKHDNYNFIQCRAAGASSKEFRFITLQVNEGPKIWGEKYVQWNDPVYVLEGPIDAMFIDNALALAGAASGLEYVTETKKRLNLPNSHVCMTFDNDYRYNPQILKLVQRSIVKGFSVVLYDKYFDEFKDINDAVKVGGWSAQEVNAYVKSRTFSGMRAQLELTAITKRW